ncbi:MAG TPA: GxxExxY protein, partial [Deltaproteobacteria bacterium]|nr:GxxExxY protein [Deltaproteobacteria bacterium]
MGKILENIPRKDVPEKKAQILFNRVNQEALEREFADQGIPFKSQPVIRIAYKGKLLDKAYQPDFVCFDEVIVEVKALDKLSGNEQSQIINYLKASGFTTGLLIKFGANSLEYK